MQRYHCLIPDVAGDHILAVPAVGGRWTLPAIEPEGDWFAFAAAGIARQATESFGVAMTALREHPVADAQVCELEIQAPHWTAPTGMRWLAHGDLAATSFEPAPLASVLRSWFEEQESGVFPPLRPPWEKRGWYAQATDWILSECARLGHAPSGPVEQVKAAWSLSCILRLATSAGTLYFKADFAKPPCEPAIIRALARRWPHNVPSLAAADLARGWMLMRDFGRRTLAQEAFPRWLEANRSFAAMQLACSTDLEPWRQLGCPDFRIPALVAHMDRLLGDPAALRIGEPDGLTVAEAARLKALAPRLHAMWHELGAIPIPNCLVQQDFRHENIVLSENVCLFYDWSDSVIGHPFFACCRFLDYIHYAPDQDLSLEERKKQITQAYIEPWSEILSPADAAQAFELAELLGPLYVALRRYLDTPYCEPNSFWGRSLRQGVPRELRRFLENRLSP